MPLLDSILSSLLQIYFWGFGISFVFFLLVMFARGVGVEGYTNHILGCAVLSFIWPFSWYEIALRCCYGF